MERKGQERKRKKRGMQFIPYDYEAAYNKSISLHLLILIVLKIITSKYIIPK